MRELQNVIERAVVLSPSSALEIDPLVLKPPSTVVALSTTPAKNALPADPTALEEMDRRHILSVLERASWVIEGSNGAARLLNLHASTLRSRMKKLGISR